MKRLLKYGLGILMAALLVTLSAVFAPPDASAAGTTGLTVKKLASDGTTVLDQKTVTWQELAAGVLNDGTPMPIMGDGVTHYYHQGPIFEDDPALRWNPAEDFNWYGKDYGALRGTNVKDLCDLVGGMSPGEEVKVKSSDGWNMKFAYENVYEYPSRTGPMVVTWEKNGMNPETGYNEGMRLVWFAEATWKEATDTSIGSANPAGMYHVFGNWDWHESAAEKYWYYYSGVYPTTTGLSGQVVSELTIYSDDPVPLTPPALAADSTGNTVGQAVDITFADDAAWRAAITDVTVNGTSIAGQYIVAAGNLNLAAGVFTAAGDYSIVVKATGYYDASVTQSLAAAAPVLVTPEVTTKGDISLAFDKAIADPTGIGAEGQFVVMVDSNSVGVSAVIKTNTAEKIKLELATKIVGGQTVTAAYTKSADAGKQIKSTDGGVLESFSAVNVTNSLPVAPVAAFTADKTSGTAPLTVSFTDASTGTTPLTWAWDFNNDGTVDSTVQNPAYQYSAAGTYSVKLTVTNAAGSDDEVKTDYITVSPAPVAPAAAFTADMTSGVAPLTVQFTDQSTGTTPLSWAWDFNNDGTVDSTEQNPSYQYTEAGTYSVKLTVTNTAGSDDEVKTSYITVIVYADFPVQLINGDATVNMSKADMEALLNTTNTYTDGNGNVFAGVPLQQLVAKVDDSDPATLNNSLLGTYNITFTGLNQDGTDYARTAAAGNWSGYFTGGSIQTDDVFIATKVKIGGTGDFVDLPVVSVNNASKNWRPAIVSGSLISGSGNRVGGLYKIELTGITPVAPVAAFTASATSGTAPLAVNFTDQSTGTTPLSWAWDFDNDGTVDSTAQNPSYQYTEAGTYSVKLTVTNDTGSDDETKTDYITVSPAPVAPVAAFTADVTSGAAPLTVQFTDQSTNSPTSWAWDFDNDGTVDSTEQSPSHDYTDAGVYTVKLTATNDVGSDDEIKTDYVTVSAPPSVDVLYDGTVNLTPDETFEVTAYNSGSKYTVYETTPLGALQAAATANGFTYDVTDKNYLASGALLLDNVGSYPYVKGGSKWYAYVNDTFKDGYNNAAGALNLIELVNGDKVEFYYAAGIADATDLNAVKAAATAAVKTVASTGVTPTDWTLQLSGAKNQSVTKSYFEDGLACANSGHYVEWADADDNVWGGVPLWLLVGMVDDNPDVGPYHFNFNDDLAAQNYEVNVIADDGFKATLQSAAIARNDGYIVANTLNGDPLPLQTEGGKPCWPLHLKGPAVLGGDQVGNIVRIELSGLPQPPEGWTLEMVGEVGDTITQEEFEAGLACTGSGHLRQWTDINDNVWSGVPLWVLLGAVDDIETSSHWTFNDALAAGYTVNVAAGDYSRTFAGADVAGSDDYIVANKVNGADLTDGWPLRLVGNGVTKLDGSLGGSSVANIDKIEIPELMTPEAAPDSWNLALYGKISDVISQAEFEDGLACPNSGHYVEWTDKDSNVWSGIPLWFLTGWVDDRLPHDYNTNQAEAGYTVLVKAEDGYTREFASTDIAWSNSYIIANKINGEPLDETSWPLRLVGTGVSTDGALSGTSVRNIAEIELTAFNTALPIPEVRIVKYAEDRATFVDEMTVDYQWMQSNLDVIGDGTTVYRYEGITNNPDDVWDSAETYPGGYKIQNAVKGTSVRDLCDLVGGMGAGTEIVFVAKDGYETTLPYSSIYTDPSVQERQGDAILAWWADGKYVPYYADGMRLFFTPGGDNVYGQWDMHETLPSNYWHYYYSDNVQYPSCAGLSAKYIKEIKIYSVPAGEWTLALDGTDIGGLQYDVSKTYFESALACQFGSDHKATYTDTEGKVWEGMPLWFLAGFVDDADQHSDNSFNDALAAAGYQVVITADDDDSVTIDSKDIIRNSNYIVANTLNGALIPDTDSSWPLRLVGPSVDETTSISKIVRIELVNTPSTEVPAAAFTGTPASGKAPLTVQFTDQSTNTPTSWAWDFDNDGTVDSTEQNPSYTYNTAGTYTVKLTATNTAGSDDEVKTDYIAAVEMDVLYDGTVNLTSGETFEVTAYNSSAAYTVDETTPLGALQAAATSDGFTYAVTDKNYATSGALLLDNVGTYLRDKTNGIYWYAYVNDVYKDGYNNAAGALNLISLSNGDKVEFYYAAGIDDPADLNAVKTAATAAVKTVVSISEPVSPPVADFTATSGTLLPIIVPQSVQFIDQSTGTAPLTYEWDFENDGVVDSTEQNPAHMYNAAGTYSVKLTVTNAAGSDDELKIDYITVSFAIPLTPPTLSADTTDNTVGQAIDITFADDSDWRGAITDVTVDGTSIAGQYTIGTGTVSINAGVFTAAGDYEIVVSATGYEDAAVTQTIDEAPVQSLTPPELTADAEGNEVGQAIEITFTDSRVWRTAITGITVDGGALSRSQYKLSKGKIWITAGVFSAAGDYQVLVSAAGYEDAGVTQSIVPGSTPALNADTSRNIVGQAIDITFDDNKAWRAAITDITVDGNSIAGYYTIGKGKIRIAPSVFTAPGDYAVVVTAGGFEDGAVTQTVLINTKTKK